METIYTLYNVGCFKIHIYSNKMYELTVTVNKMYYRYHKSFLFNNLFWYSTKFFPIQNPEEAREVDEEGREVDEGAGRSMRGPGRS